MSDFERLCAERHAAGVREYRGGDASAPFNGDPVAEALEEAADLAIYAIEAQRSGQLSPVSAELVRRLAERAFEILVEHGRTPR